MTSSASRMKEPLSQGLGRDLVTKIRALILNGTIAPGSKLLPREVQARFGVSHIPVREAFRALESEGLVVTLAHRGTRVAGVSVHELHEVYTLRRALEPGLMADAVRARGDTEVVRARLAHQRLLAATGGDGNLFLDAHQAFHVTVLQPALGPLTERMLHHLWTVSERYVRMSPTAFHTDEIATHDHAALLDAFVTGDSAAAEHETAHHLELIEHAMTEALRGLID